jgi:hypothetical protein
MYVGISVNYPLFFADFNLTWIFWIDFWKTLTYEILRKSFQWKTCRSMRTDGQTGVTKRIAAFRNIANESKRKMVYAALLYDMVGTVNTGDVWRHESYYTIACVNAVHVSRSGYHWAVALQSCRYGAVSNGSYFRQKWHRISPFRATHRL